MSWIKAVLAALVVVLGVGIGVADAGSAGAAVSHPATSHVMRPADWWIP